MSKKYVFKFEGTKDAFFEILDSYPNNDGACYYLDEYMVKIVGDKIHFGIEQCGHSAGNWFVATITESDNHIEFSGKIEYIGSEGERSAVRKVLDKVEEGLLVIFLLPIILVFKLYKFIEWCVRKICKRTNPKERTTEDKLYDLMEHYLECVKG